MTSISASTASTSSTVTVLSTPTKLICLITSLLGIIIAAHKVFIPTMGQRPSKKQEEDPPHFQFPRYSIYDEEIITEDEEKERLDHLAEVLQRSPYFNEKLRFYSSTWEPSSPPYSPTRIPYHTHMQATSWRPKYARTTSHQGAWPVDLS